MNRTAPFALLVTAALVLGAAVAPTPAEAGALVVVKAPPSPRIEVRESRPGPDHVWVAGHWRWNGRCHVWSAGTWVRRPSPHSTWVGGHWVKRHGGWTWLPGHWRRT